MTEAKRPRRKKQQEAQGGCAGEGRAREPADTVEIARRVQREAREQLWNNLLERVEQFVRSRFKSRDLPPGLTLDDLASLTMERVFRGLGKIEIRNRESFWGWVRKVATNAASDMWRREGRRRFFVIDRNHSAGGGTQTDPCAKVPGPSSLRPSHIARIREMYRTFLSCLHGFRPEEVEVLRLRLLEHRSYKEIAEAVGRRKTVTVRTIFLRARRRLAEAMAAKGYKDSVDW